MPHAAPEMSRRAEADRLLQEIADYTLTAKIESEGAWETARYCLLDALGCGLLGLGYPACGKLIGPIVPEATLPGGARVPGTSHELDPVQAAFCIGTIIRWLDFNDTWLAVEWGHPSDNLGGILAVADYLGRRPARDRRDSLTMRSVLEAMIKAYEIQGVLALNHGFNRLGLDHVLLVRIASTAVVTWQLGGAREEVVNAVSHAFIDGGAAHLPTRAEHRFPEVLGRRRRDESGGPPGPDDPAGRDGLPLGLDRADLGFPGCAVPRAAPRPARPLDSYVIENILFKISFPAEFHAQTAVEAAIAFHPRVKDRLGEIETIRIETQESALRIIDKVGPLKNPADRDHCLQYMVAVALLKGDLRAEDYEDDAAADPRIDWLRDRMVVTEDPRMSADYLDPAKRSIGNAVQVVFRGGQSTEKVTVDYPIGHRRRRPEGIPRLLFKFEKNLRSRLSPRAVDRILDSSADQDRLERMPVPEFVSLFVP